MKHLPNFLSFLRIPLALAFFQNDTTIRLAAIIAAMGTDFLDGMLARKLKINSRLGTVLDPIGDKCFVLIGLIAFYREDSITLAEIGCMLARDAAVLSFGLYLYLTNRWKAFRIKAIMSGKVATAIQLFTLLALTLGVTVPGFIYASLLLLGIGSFGELLIETRLNERTENH